MLPAASDAICKLNRAAQKKELAGAEGVCCIHLSAKDYTAMARLFLITVMASIVKEVRYSMPIYSIQNF